MCFLSSWKKPEKFYSKCTHCHDSVSGTGMWHGLKYMYIFHFLLHISSGTVWPLERWFSMHCQEKLNLFLDFFLFFYSIFTGLHLLRKQMSTRASMRQSAAACGWDHLFWQKQAVTWAQLPHDTSLYTKQRVTGFPKAICFTRNSKTSSFQQLLGKTRFA